MSSTTASTMNDLIFENINDEYGRGKFGNFNVIIMKKNGYINVTKLCKDGGKEFRKWRENKNSTEFIEEFSSDVGIPAADFLIVINSGNTNILIRGTYAHPELVPHIASWVSAKFARKVSRIVNDYFGREARLENERLKYENVNLKGENVNLMGKLEEMEKKADEERKKSDEERKKAEEERKKSDEERKKAEERYANLCKQYNITHIKLDTTHEKLDIANDRIEVMEEKLDTVAEIVVPKTKNLLTHEMFCLLKHENNNDDEFEYYAICGQIKYVKNTKNKKIKTDNMTEVLTIDCTPNTKNLLHRIKEQLKDRIQFRGNKIDRNTITERQLIKKINDINDEKYEVCDVK